MLKVNMDNDLIGNDLIGNDLIDNDFIYSVDLSQRMRAKYNKRYRMFYRRDG